MMWLMNLGFAASESGAGPSLIAQERSLFRAVFARLFSRVN